MSFLIRIEESTEKKLFSSYGQALLWRFSTCVSQNAHVNTARCAMMCDMQFPFPKIL